jgi:hypothetical protein
MKSDPRIEHRIVALDDAFALALDLTDYVSTSVPPIKVIRCRAPQPRDVLRQFTVAWERGEQELLMASLGPRAERAVEVLQQGRDWEKLGAVISTEANDRLSAVGFRFQIPDIWSTPEAELEPSLPPSPTHFDLRTVFTDRDGNRCGSMQIKFVRVPGRMGISDQMDYLIDNEDLREVLSTIAACAARHP